MGLWEGLKDRYLKINSPPTSDTLNLQLHMNNFLGLGGN